jgi:subtilisin family serine protease
VSPPYSPDANDRLSADAIALVGGLDWLAKRKVEIVNMSLSGEPNALVEIAIGRLSKRGVIFIAAVGNGGAAAAPGFPASLPDVIGVTAVDSDGVLYKNAPRGGEIDFAAPGVRIWARAATGAAAILAARLRGPVRPQLRCSWTGRATGCTRAMPTTARISALPKGPRGWA